MSNTIPIITKNNNRELKNIFDKLNYRLHKNILSIMTSTTKKSIDVFKQLKNGV